MSASVACSDTTQKRMTYLPRTMDGIMCTFPDALSAASSCWFRRSEPRRRKHTSPSCRAGAGLGQGWSRSGAGLGHP